MLAREGKESEKIDTKIAKRIFYSEDDVSL